MWPTSLVRGVPKRPWDGAASVALAALLLLSAAGCAARQRVQPQILTGSFHGETDDGRPVVITFTENEEAFRGEGTIGGEPLVLAGAVGWRGVASLVSAAGDTALVELTLAPDGTTVFLERPGEKPLALSRGGAAPPAASGPFSGSFHARRDRATLAQVTLVQSGPLLVGVGIVAGEPAGITGRTTGARAADGVVTLLDGTQARFLAELAADGESIVVHGFGAPIEMQRGGRP